MNNESSKRVFLGGTRNNSTWRNQLIDTLNIDHFNPIVDDWTPECMEEEIRQRELCDFLLYVITPAMTGVYSIAEAVDDSNKRPHKTLFCALDTEDGVEYFTSSQMKSLDAVSSLIKRNGGTICKSLREVADALNFPPEAEVSP